MKLSKILLFYKREVKIYIGKSCNDLKKSKEHDAESIDDYNNVIHTMIFIVTSAIYLRNGKLYIIEARTLISRIKFEYVRH